MLHAIELIEKARKEARERRLLQTVEQARLIATGLAQQDAENQARAVAEAMVQEAGQIRNAEAGRAVASLQFVSPPPVNMAGIARAASHPVFMFEPSRPNRFGRVVGLFVGSHVRAVLGGGLLAACALWAHQNGLIPGADVQARAQAAIESNNLSGFKDDVALGANRATQPLRISNVPEPLTAWADSFNVGLAGLLLFGSPFYRGNSMAMLVLLSAVVAVTGHRLGIRSVELICDYHVALMLGSVGAPYSPTTRAVPSCRVSRQPSAVFSRRRG